MQFLKKITTSLLPDSQWVQHTLNLEGFEIQHMDYPMKVIKIIYLPLHLDCNVHFPADNATEFYNIFQAVRATLSTTFQSRRKFGKNKHGVIKVIKQ